MENLKQEVIAIKETILARGLFDELQKLELMLQDPDFYQREDAQSLSSRAGVLRKILNSFQSLEESLNNLGEIKEILSEDELNLEVSRIHELLSSVEDDLFLSGEYDQYNAILHFKVGAGGKDASSWAQMLMNMYLKYISSLGWKTEILDLQEAEVGIKSSTIRVSGSASIFGSLKNESGSHRLVRRSPFNAANSRETSFAHLEVLPEIQNDKMINIQDQDIRIDTFRAQGAGGQHVNTTDSAVRITHLPTSISVQCQNERSQLQNKRRAMQVLKSRLLDLQIKEKANKEKKHQNKKTHASFGGGHIRSYVLDDNYVKDVRTEYKSTQADKVLNGEIEEFIKRSIRLG